MSCHKGQHILINQLLSDIFENPILSLSHNKPITLLSYRGLIELKLRLHRT